MSEYFTGDKLIADQNHIHIPVPKAWLLMGHKAGDNAQVLALAEALGWPFEIKSMVYRTHELATNLLLGPNLAGLVKSKCSPLAPPWPDLVITAGRRNEPVARWIRKKADAGLRIVHFGRPWAAPKRFDLVITTPQYVLPASSNILHNMLPLNHVPPGRLDEARKHWLPRFTHLPRPFIAVMVGGHSGHHTFSKEKASQLVSQATDMARREGGSLLVTTSPRTPLPVVEAMRSAIDVPVYFFQWTNAASENPYYGYLAIADAFIVSGDSMSMLTEACITRKPVYIFDVARTAKTNTRHLISKLGKCRDLRLKGVADWIATKLAPQRMVRDVGVIQRQLIAGGRAAWLGQPFVNASDIPELDDLGRAVTRVRELFGMGPEYPE